MDFKGKNWKKEISMSMMLIIFSAILALLPGFISKADISISSYLNDINSKLNSKGELDIFWEESDLTNEIDINSNDFNIISKKIASIKYYLGEELNNDLKLVKKGNSVIVSNSKGQLSTFLENSKKNTIGDGISIEELSTIGTSKKAKEIVIVDISNSETSHNNEIFTGEGNVAENLKIINEVVTEYEKMGW